ncbi:FxSxx-COOH system tetratricopeptide repeat protein [Streptomyces bullii]|uniref:FxSxx-COOH system tetratricopeptide repeat protein n=1 Tax=Streptomyces bullii TaxID=349910 RepID=A0ABW0UX58_9ACTN
MGRGNSGRKRKGGGKAAGSGRLHKQSAVPPYTPSGDPFAVTAHTGDARATDGATAVTGLRGTVVGRGAWVRRTGNASASGPNSVAISGAGDVTVVQAPSEPPQWPQVVGNPPTPASPFQERAEVRERIESARNRHATVVLTQVLRGGGGVGKSQLAAKLAWEALDGGTDLVVWVNAAYPGQVVAEYAGAARRVGARGADGQDAEVDARAFLDWLAGTRRRWLVVLDDVADPDALAAWWPPASLRGRGRVLATTRRRDAVLSGGGRTVVEVDSYTPAEAVAYLEGRLAEAGADHLKDGTLADLAAALGLLPLALSHAAAYMINEDVACEQYLRLFQDRHRLLDEVLPASADTEGYGRQVAAALLLSLDAARAADPVGLAVPALRLIAHLDPAGHPRELWHSRAVLRYLRAHREPRRRLLRPRTGPEQVRAVLRLLHRYGLITDDSTQGRRAVRLHALTARAARETVPGRDLPATVRATTEALEELWPELDQTDPDLAAVLRANTSAVAACAEDTVWADDDARLLLWRAGKSLLDAGAYTTAFAYWEDLTERAGRRLGQGHRHTLLARNNLASAYGQVGRIRDAIALQERGLEECEQELGTRHRATLIARANLGVSYQQAGRISEALAVLEQVAADRERHLGAGHPDFENSLVNLAPCYWHVGRTDEAIRLLERINTGRGRADDPNTLTVRYVLAQSYHLAGRTQEAIRLMERVIADRERQLGPDHPETLAARGSLAACYLQDERSGEAIALLEPNVADWVRLHGPQHPSTVASRAHLANAYWKAGSRAEAIALLDMVVADRRRLFSSSHPETVKMAATLRQWQREQRPRRG